MNTYTLNLIKEAERLSQKEGLKDLLDIGILPVSELQKWVVRALYFEEKNKGCKTCKEIKLELSEAYAVSYNLIEKLVYR